MRRAAARWLAALALALSAPAAGDAPQREVDALPQPPSPEQRLEQIRERVQAAVVYPARARERGLEGTARIQFRVAPSGRADAVSTLESSGSGLLDAAAEQAARDARALPQLYGWVRIPVRFELRSARTDAAP
jgi:TonB family protein